METPNDIWIEYHHSSCGTKVIGLTEKDELYFSNSELHIINNEQIHPYFLCGQIEVGRWHKWLKIETATIERSDDPKETIFSLKTIHDERCRIFVPYTQDNYVTYLTNGLRELGNIQIK